MNWRQHPHLFANGKFEVMLDWDDISPFKILGYSSENNGFLFKGSRLFYESIDVCQLIARPIEDMSNSEVAKALRFQGIEHEGRDFGYFENLLFDIVNENYEEQGGYAHEITPLTAKSQNYLLSIGVYPFSDTEDVIFRSAGEQVS